MQTLEIINLIIVILIGVANVYTVYSAPSRKKKQQAQEAEKKEEKRKADQLETYRCILRGMILRTYREHVATKSIQQYEYEETVKTYENYKKIGGNSFVDKIWDEMQDWEIIS